MIYLIGGCPNSGTSALTEKMEQSGVNLGRNTKGLILIVRGEYPKLELREACGLNREILHFNGFDMFNLDGANPLELKKPAGIGEKIRDLASKIDRFPFAMKDPKFAVTWKIWADELQGYDVEFRFSMRDQRENVASLLKRKFTTTEESGNLLWANYKRCIGMAPKERTQVLEYRNGRIS